MKTMIIVAICLDKYVNCSWHVVRLTGSPRKTSCMLFSIIVDLWVTMREFAYASAWMEKQKSKGLKNYNDLI